MFSLKDGHDLSLRVGEISLSSQAMSEDGVSVIDLGRLPLSLYRSDVVLFQISKQLNLTKIIINRSLPAISFHSWILLCKKSPLYS